MKPKSNITFKNSKKNREYQKKKDWDLFEDAYEFND